MIQHDMPRLSVHGLRHTWATLALQAGVHPKIVQELLGHSTIAITLDIYSQVNPVMDAEAANTVAALIQRHRLDRVVVAGPVAAGRFATGAPPESRGPSNRQGTDQKAGPLSMVGVAGFELQRGVFSGAGGWCPVMHRCR